MSWIGAEVVARLTLRPVVPKMIGRVGANSGLGASQTAPGPFSFSGLWKTRERSKINVTIFFTWTERVNPA